MKVQKESVHLIIYITILASCGSYSSAVRLKEEKNFGSQNEIKTSFVNALQIKEKKTDSEENDMEHKLKLSLKDMRNAESSSKNIVYLLKDKELKGFLRTLPIEMLRKLRSLASRDIESAQNFVIKLARERKRAGGDFKFTKRTEKLDSEAKPLISSGNFTRTFIFNNVEMDKENVSSLNPGSPSGFLSDYKFKNSSPKNIRNDSDDEIDNGQSQWTPVNANPPQQYGNASTVTYIVHEVMNPKYENSLDVTTTTANYPSLQPPIKNPLPTPPVFHESPPDNYKPENYKPDNYKPENYKPDNYKPDNYKPDNYKPDNYKPDNNIPDNNKPDHYKPTLYSSVHNSSRHRFPKQFMDSYYGASRQVQGANNFISTQTGGKVNTYQNPTILLPHLPLISPEYAWTIAQVQSPTNSLKPTYTNNGNAVHNPTQEYDKYQENPEYSPANGNNINIRNNNQASVPHNSPNVQEFSISNSNPPSYQLYPSPTDYYTMKPFITYQHTSPQNPGLSTTTNTNVYHYPDNNVYGSSHSNNLHGWSGNNHGATSWHSSGDHHNDHYKGLWHKAKAYLYKGDRSVAQKVFEISLAILAFLAFAGYITTLIYQVFAATATVPLFPLATQAIPSNPSLFGILFGRSFTLSEKNSFLDYLDKIENQVRIAIKNYSDGTT